MEIVVAQFIAHVQTDEQARSHAHSQAKHADGSVAQIASQVAQCNCQVVFDHG